MSYIRRLLTGIAKDVVRVPPTVSSSIGPVAVASAREDKALGMERGILCLVANAREIMLLCGRPGSIKHVAGSPRYRTVGWMSDILRHV